MVAQNGLEQNLDMLRMSLYGLGEPRVEGGCLWFGTHRMNGDSALVDAVKAKFGGAATIFLGDQRIATNVQNANGSRALGTRLAPGPAYDRVLRQGLSYRGQTEIFGEAYLALYEPISCDGAVIGLLFAGIRKASAVAAAEPVKRVKPAGWRRSAPRSRRFNGSSKSSRTRRRRQSHSARPPMTPGGVSMPSAKRRHASKSWPSRHSQRGWSIWLPGISYFG